MQILWIFLPAGLHKGVKEGLRPGVGVAEPLRVPLDAEAEAGVRPFQPLNEAVLAEGGDHKPRGGLVGHLMVLAVDEEGVLPDDLREQGAPAEGDGVDLGPVVVVGDVLEWA